MSEADMVVEVDQLQMQYGAAEVLRGLTFQLRQGEVLALLGPNGAGKTTTIEILEGFRMRSAGQVRVLGIDPAQADEGWRGRVGVVIQSWRDHGKWRVRELLNHQRGYYTGDCGEPWPVDDLMAEVGLDRLADAKIKTLSGGQRRRLDLAIALVGRPELLFLDEPTAALDPVARREFHDLLRRVATAATTTIMITTHDLDEAEKLSDRIIILADGAIIASGTSAELADEIVGEDEVRWTYRGERFVRAVPDSTGFVRDLFHRYGGDVAELELRRASLEDTYLALIRRYESASVERADSVAGAVL